MYLPAHRLLNQYPEVERDQQRKDLESEGRDYLRANRGALAQAGAEFARNNPDLVRKVRRPWRLRPLGVGSRSRSIPCVDRRSSGMIQETRLPSIPSALSRAVSLFPQGAETAASTYV